MVETGKGFVTTTTWHDRDEDGNPTVRDSFRRERGQGSRCPIANDDFQNRRSFPEITTGFQRHGISACTRPELRRIVGEAGISLVDLTES